MNTEPRIPLEITSEIERLRHEFPDTQALYREVCVLLFFRHGITPTANKLYQLVRKGSMSAPTEALRAFWADLREKSRVRIENPDIPESLKAAAGELVAALWQQAQAASHADLAVFRADASESVHAAQSAQKAAEMEVSRRSDELAAAQRQTAEMQERLLGLERQLAAERANCGSLRTQLDGSAQQIESLNSELSDARREFASELEKQREALDRTEERLQGSERRALLEIDRERTVAIRLQREVEQLRQAGAEADDRHQISIDEYQVKLTDVLQKLGQAEGMALAQKEANREIATQLDAVRLVQKETETHLLLCQKEIEGRDTKIKVLEAQVESTLSTKSISPRTRLRKNVFIKKQASEEAK